MIVERLATRRILLIITGGIAAYKSLDLIRRLREAGAGVRCVLTANGAKFVTPLSVAALSEHPVLTALDEDPMAHIRLSREADLVLVAPATANILAKMAHGLADDLASTVLLASNKPVMIAPAMNGQMWTHEATQANLALLQKRGIIIVGPDAGALACGEEGAGRMSEPMAILEKVAAHFAGSKPLSGLRALVTSGPTYEPLDPVRFLGNRSSGKQGHAIAAALARQGAETILVTGPTHQPDPIGVKTIRVETAQEMLAACEAALPCAVAVCAAAVADWRPVAAAADKIKKGAAEPVLQLTENPDILAILSRAETRRPKLVIGFAAETTALLENAAKKLDRKGCDWLVANEVGTHKIFGSDDTEITLLRRDAKPSPWPRQSKHDVARRLVAEIVGCLRKTNR